MSKYIDADKLHSQGWVAARYINWEPTPFNDNFRLEVEVKPFNTFSAADVVEVVRCRECKYRKYGNYSKEYYCEYDAIVPYERKRNAKDSEWFCADGEKNE